MAKKLFWLLAVSLLLTLPLAAQTNPCGGTQLHCNIITLIPGVQPAGETVAKWNLYKSSTSGVYTATPFATNTDPSVLKFQDNTVLGGQTNFYVATAVDQLGTESVHSIELVSKTPVTIPLTPSISVQSF